MALGTEFIHDDYALRHCTRLYHIFLDQDYTNEYFDVIFWINGRELYAHSSVLATHSPVFKAQLIELRDNSNGQAIYRIQIEDYTYIEFYDFLSLLYTPFQIIYLDDDEVFTLSRMADTYKTEKVHDICDETATRHFPATGPADTMLKFMELAQQYSLKDFTAKLKQGVKIKFKALLKHDRFEDLDKSVIILVSSFLTLVPQIEQFLEFLYKSILDRVPEKSDTAVNKAVNAKLAEFLPHLQLKKMTLSFLINFCVPLGLMSLDEARKLKKTKITISYISGKLFGAFIDEYGLFEYLDSNKQLKLDGTINGKRMFWGKRFQLPTRPSTVQVTDDFNWYFLFDEWGLLSVKHKSLILYSDFLIAALEADHDYDSGEFMSNNVYDYFVSVEHEN